MGTKRVEKNQADIDFKIKSRRKLLVLSALGLLLFSFVACSGGSTEGSGDGEPGLIAGQSTSPSQAWFQGGLEGNAYLLDDIEEGILPVDQGLQRTTPTLKVHGYGEDGIELGPDARAINLKAGDILLSGEKSIQRVIEVQERPLGKLYALTTNGTFMDAFSNLDLLAGFKGIPGDSDETDSHPELQPVDINPVSGDLSDIAGASTSGSSSFAASAASERSSQRSSSESDNDKTGGPRLARHPEDMSITDVKPTKMFKNAKGKPHMIWPTALGDIGIEAKEFTFGLFPTVTLTADLGNFNRQIDQLIKDFGLESVEARTGLGSRLKIPGAPSISLVPQTVTELKHSVEGLRKNASELSKSTLKGAAYALKKAGRALEAEVFYEVGLEAEFTFIFRAKGKGTFNMPAFTRLNDAGSGINQWRFPVGWGFFLRTNVDLVGELHMEGHVDTTFGFSWRSNIVLRFEKQPGQDWEYSINKNINPPEAIPPKKGDFFDGLFHMKAGIEFETALLYLGTVGPYIEIGTALSFTVDGGDEAITLSDGSSEEVFSSGISLDFLLDVDVGLKFDIWFGSVSIGAVVLLEKSWNLYEAASRYITGTIQEQAGTAESLSPPDEPIPLLLKGPDGLRKTLTTNKDGTFVFKELPLGSYKLQSADKRRPLEGEVITFEIVRPSPEFSDFDSQIKRKVVSTERLSGVRPKLGVILLEQDVGPLPPPRTPVVGSPLFSNTSPQVIKTQWVEVTWGLPIDKYGENDETKSSEYQVQLEYAIGKPIQTSFGSGTVRNWKHYHTWKGITGHSKIIWPQLEHKRCRVFVKHVNEFGDSGWSAGREFDFQAAPVSLQLKSHKNMNYLDEPVLFLWNGFQNTGWSHYHKDHADGVYKWQLEIAQLDEEGKHKVLSNGRFEIDLPVDSEPSFIWHAPEAGFYYARVKPLSPSNSFSPTYKSYWTEWMNFGVVERGVEEVVQQAPDQLKPDQEVLNSTPLVLAWNYEHQRPESLKGFEVRLEYYDQEEEKRIKFEPIAIANPQTRSYSVELDKLFKAIDKEFKDLDSKVFTWEVRAFWQSEVEGEDGKKEKEFSNFSSSASFLLAPAKIYSGMIAVPKNLSPDSLDSPLMGSVLPLHFQGVSEQPFYQFLLIENGEKRYFEVEKAKDPRARISFRNREGASSESLIEDFEYSLIISDTGIYSWAVRAGDSRSGTWGVWSELAHFKVEVEPALILSSLDPHAHNFTLDDTQVGAANTTKLSWQTTMGEWDKSSSTNQSLRYEVMVYAKPLHSQELAGDAGDDGSVYQLLSSETLEASIPSGTHSSSLELNLEPAFYLWYLRASIVDPLQPEEPLYATTWHKANFIINNPNQEYQEESLPAPQDFSFKMIGDVVQGQELSFTATWSPVEGASSYRLELYRQKLQNGYVKIKEEDFFAPSEDSAYRHSLMNRSWQLDPERNYILRVQAISASGQPGESKELTFDTQGLESVEIIAPEGSVPTGKVKLLWQGNDQALNYRVEASWSNGRFYGVQSVQRTAQTSLELNIPVASQCEVKIWPLDQYGIPGEVAQRSFTTSKFSILKSVEIIAPQSGEVVTLGSSNLILLQAQPFPEAKSYQVRVFEGEAMTTSSLKASTDPGEAQGNIQKLEVFENLNSSWMVQLEANKTYRWTIAAFDESGRKLSSYTQSLFTTTLESSSLGLFLDKPAGLSPGSSVGTGELISVSGDGAQEVALDWEPVQGAHWYEVKVEASKDGRYVSLAQSKEAISGTKYVANLLPGEQKPLFYAWAVRAWGYTSAGGRTGQLSASQWNRVFFFLGKTLAAPQILEPTDSIVHLDTQGMVKISCEEHEGAQNYELKVFEENQPYTPKVINSISAASWKIELQPEKNYRCDLRYRDRHGNLSGWGSVSFQTVGANDNVLLGVASDLRPNLHKDPNIEVDPLSGKANVELRWKGSNTYYKVVFEEWNGADYQERSEHSTPSPINGKTWQVQLGVGQWSFQVYAAKKNFYGQWVFGEASERADFDTVLPAAERKPDTPRIIKPGSLYQEMRVNGKVRVEWLAASGAAYYRMKASLLGGFHELGPYIKAKDDRSHEFAFNHLGRWLIEVWAVNEEGLESDSAEVEVYVKQDQLPIITSPIPFSPTSNEWVTHWSVYLHWSTVIGAEKYEIEIQQQELSSGLGPGDWRHFKNIEVGSIGSGEAAATSTYGSGFHAGRNYRWRIRGLNSTSQGPWSSGWNTFRTGF